MARTTNCNAKNNVARSSAIAGWLLVLVFIVFQCQGCGYPVISDGHRVYSPPRTGVDRFIVVDGHTVHYVEAGSGSPVLLIPGAFCTYRVWDRMIPYLSENYRVLALDYLGVGDSDKPAEGFRYTVEEQADIVSGVIRGLGFRKVRVIGASYGSMIALNMAARYPELVEGVVCIEGGAFIVPDVLRYHGMSSVLGWPVLGDALLGLMRTNLFRETVAKSVMGHAWESMSPIDREEIAGILSANVKTASRVSWHRIDETIRGTIDFTEAARKCRVPVLYLYGGESKYLEMAERNARFLRESLPAAEVARIEDGIHDLQMQHPGQVTEIIARSWGKGLDRTIRFADYGDDDYLSQ